MTTTISNDEYENAIKLLDSGSSVAEIAAYWFEDDRRGVSVSSFMRVAKALGASRGDESLGFQLAKTVFTRFNLEDLKKTTDKTLEAIGRELEKGFPGDARVAELFNSVGVKTLAGKAYYRRPPIHTLDILVPKVLSTEALAELREAAPIEFGMPLADEFPDFEAFAKGDRELIKFIPTYKTVGVDVEWLSRRLHPKAFSAYKEPFKSDCVKAASIVFKGIERVADTFIMTNGDLPAQMGRLAKGLDIVKNLGVRKYSREEEERHFQVYMSVCPIEDAPQLDFAKISTLMEFAAAREEADERNLFNFNKKSSSGCAFTKGTKVGNVIPQTIIMADLLNDAVVAGETTAFQVLEVAQCKPKYEPIEVEKALKNIRNIYVPTTAGQITMTMLLRGAKTIDVLTQWREHKFGFLEEFSRNEAKATKIFKQITARNFVGSNFFNGGMNDLIDFFYYYALVLKQTTLFVYADNLYILTQINGNWFLISADGRSFEIQNTATSARRMVKRVLLGNHVPEDHKFSKYTDWWMNTAINAHVVLGKYQFINPGLTSGTAATAPANTAKMSEVVTSYVEAKRPPVVESDPTTDTGYKFTNKFQQVLNNVAIDLKLERVTRLPFYDLDVKNVFLDLDMLGFGAYAVFVGGKRYWVGVLAEDKIYKAIAFNKLEGRKDFTATQQVSLRLIKYRVLYLVGGWCYEALSLTLTNLCNAALDQLRDSFDSSMLTMAIESIEAEIQVEGLSDTERSLMISSFTETAVPTPYQVMAFSLGAKIAEDWAAEVERVGGKLVAAMGGLPKMQNDTNRRRPAPRPIPSEVVTAKRLVDDGVTRDSVEFRVTPGASLSTEKSGSKPLPQTVDKTDTDILFGTMSKRTKMVYDNMDKKEKEDIRERIIGVLTHLNKTFPSFVGMAKTKELKTAKFDVARFLSEVLGENIFLVVDAIDKVVNSGVLRYPIRKSWATTNELIMVKLGTLAALMKAGGDKVTSFISQNYRDLMEGRLDWSEYEALENIIEDDESRARLVELLQEHSLKVPKAFLFRGDMQIDDDNDDFDDDYGIQQEPYPDDDSKTVE